MAHTHLESVLGASRASEGPADVALTSLEYNWSSTPRSTAPPCRAHGGLRAVDAVPGLLQASVWVTQGQGMHRGGVVWQGMVAGLRCGGVGYGGVRVWWYPP